MHIDTLQARDIVVRASLNTNLKIEIITENTQTNTHTQEKSVLPGK